MTNLIRLIRWWVALAACLFAGAALASSPRDVTPEERALLSPWCNHTNGMPGYREMLSRYGQGWSHMHHYCYAEIDSLRLMQPGLNKPRGYASVRRAISNLDYVLRNTGPDFVFWSDVMILKTRILDRSGDLAQAVKTAQQLVSGAPKLADGYTLLAGLLLKAGKREEARTILSVGQERASDQERFALQKSILSIE